MARPSSNSSASVGSALLLVIPLCRVEPRACDGGRIVESPRVGQWPIQREEVPASAVEAPPHRLSGHVMSTGPNAFRDSGQCKIDGRQPEVDDVHAVPALLQLSESPNE